jgi:hypothetical protein
VNLISSDLKTSAGDVPRRSPVPSDTNLTHFLPGRGPAAWAKGFFNTLIGAAWMVLPE